MDRELAWAAGTYEYRAMGVAVISNTDLFRGSDFRAGRRAPPLSSPSYAGHFTSLGHVNAFLLERRRLRKRGQRRSRPPYLS